MELQDIEQRHLGPVVDARLGQRVGVIGRGTGVDGADRSFGAGDFVPTVRSNPDVCNLILYK
jgi:hypothetical protein